MSVIISMITGVYTTALAWCGKVFSSLMTKVVAWCSKLGLKILSISWIKKIYEYVKKALSVIRRTIFNARFVTFVKYFLSVGICALAILQTIFVAIGFFENFSVVIGAFEDHEFETIGAVLLVFIGFTYSLISSFRCLKKIANKHIDLRFVGVLLLTYITILCYDNLVSTEFLDVVFEKITLINVIGIVTAVYAFFAIFDESHMTSGFGTILIGAGLFILFLFFKKVLSSDLLFYEMTGEVSFSIKDLSISRFLAEVKNPYMYGREWLLATWCTEVSGEFLSSVLIALNLFVMIGCAVLPYLLLSVAVCLVLALASDRVRQYIHLSKAISALAFVLLYFVLILCVSIVIDILFNGATDTFIVVSLNKGGVFTTLIGIFLAMIISAIARKLIADKPYAKKTRKGLK